MLVVDIAVDPIPPLHGNERILVTFRLSLLGGLSLDGPEGPLSGRVTQRRQVALLALLAASPSGSVRRDKLVAWLWPETGEKRARSLLSDTLYVVRRELGEEAIDASGETVVLDPAVVTSDVAEFRAAFEANDFERAVDLYAGPFLDGVDLAGSAELERWVADERARLERCAARAARECAGSLGERGELARAERYARRALAIEPTDEAALRGLLRILDRRGDRAGAIRAYEAFEERLAAELDVEPAPETEALVTEIRSRDIANGSTRETDVALSSPPDPVAGGTEPGSSDGDRPRRWVMPNLAGITVVVGAVLIISALFPDRPTAFPPPEGGAAIAVLPFEIQGDGLDLWGEGMVDVLSANLDGVGGLRAIDSRTVLARWREALPGGEIPDTSTALEIARRTGARYALMGSVIASGDGMRVVTDLYDLPSGRRLGRPGIEGSPDSIFALVDRLSVEILRPLFEGDPDLSEIDLARATTSSPAALQAFLEGEARYRVGDFEEAIPLYRRAIEADSSFGQVYYRLERAYGWTRPPERRELAERAYRLADRLPERDALLARGLFAFEAGRADGLEVLRRVTLLYPDEAEAWDLLGDFIVHLGGALLVDPKEGRDALRRAIELDPRFASPYRHTIHHAMRYEPDSATVGGLVDTYGHLAPGTVGARQFRAMDDVAFGGDSARAAALAVLDTLTGRFLPYLALPALSHPRFLDDKIELLEMAREGPSRDEARVAATLLVETHLARGEMKAAFRAVDHPVLAGAEWVGERSRHLYLAHVKGYPIPVARLERDLGAAPVDDESERLFYVGAWALDQGRPQAHRRALGRLRTAAERALADGDTIRAEAFAGVALALEGLAAWRRGDLEGAKRRLDRARVMASWVGGGAVSRIARWWLAEIALERGRLERAERYFLSLGHGAAFATDPVAVYRQARVQERLGRTEEAERNYEYFLAAFRDPDPELRPLADDARRAVARLQRSRRE